MQLLNWSTVSEAYLQILTIYKEEGNSLITANWEEKTIDISIQFTDDASIENAIHCWCLLLYLGIPQTQIKQKFWQLEAVAMRLELKTGINHCSIINDSYSADITSLSIALDFLQQQQQHPKRTVIISDILQSGKNNQQLYNEVADILHQKNINRFIGVGSEISKYQDCFVSIPDKIFFKDTAEFIKQFSTLHFYNETILLKGARVFEFEQI